MNKTTQPDLAALFCQNQQSVHTQTNAKYQLASFARWLESEHHVTDLEAVTVQHVLSYKSHLASNGLQPTSQARALETLRSFFRWCHAEGLIDHDPAQLVKSPRAVLNQEPDYLTTDESRKLFDAIDPNGQHAKRDRAMAWALAVGLRVGEVVSLNVADVIPPVSSMSADTPPNGGLGLAGLRVHGKRSYERIIPLPQVAYAALAAYLKERGRVTDDAPLFACHYAGESGRRMTTRAVQKWFAGVVTSAGLATGKAHPHACRHGAAMRWLYQSNTPGGIYTVSRMLGHSSIQTTQRYLHVGPQGRAAMESAVMSDPLTA
jgi:site-specific recombinase XerD